MRAESFHQRPPPLPGFTPPCIAPSAHDVFTPHLLLSPCLRVYSSSTLAKSPPDEKTGAKQRQLGCLSERKPTFQQLLFLYRSVDDILKKTTTLYPATRKHLFRWRCHRWESGGESSKKSSSSSLFQLLLFFVYAPFSNLPLSNCVFLPPPVLPRARHRLRAGAVPLLCQVPGRPDARGTAAEAAMRPHPV